MRMYSVFDKKVGYFRSPISCQNDTVLMRNLHDESRLYPKDLIFASAEDFSIYYVGDFDLMTGAFRSAEVPILIAEISDIVAKKVDDNE